MLIDTPESDDDEIGLIDESHFKISPVEEIRLNQCGEHTTSRFTLNPIKMEKLLDSTPRGAESAKKRIDTEMTDIELLEAQLQLELLKDMAKQRKKELVGRETLEVLPEA